MLSSSCCVCLCDELNVQIDLLLLCPFIYISYVSHNSSATNRLITAKDHASVQINVGKVDSDGKLIPGEFETFALCGYIRAVGEADAAVNRLARQHGLVKRV
jgi:hypothetical protein